MFDKFMNILGEITNAVSPNLLVIIACAVILFNFFAGLIITRASGVSKNKRGLRAYNIECEQSGLRTREDFYTLDAMINKHETIMTEPWTACYPDSIHGLVLYAMQVRDLQLIKPTSNRRNFMLVISLLFAILCFPVLAGAKLMAFTLPLLVVFMAFVFESIFTIVDNHNRRVFSNEYNLFCAYILKGVSRVYSVRFRQCAGFESLDLDIGLRTTRKVTEETAQSDDEDETAKAEEEIMRERIEAISVAARAKTQNEKTAKPKKKKRKTASKTSKSANAKSAEKVESVTVRASTVKAEPDKKSSVISFEEYTAPSVATYESSMVRAPKMESWEVKAVKREQYTPVSRQYVAEHTGGYTAKRAKTKTKTVRSVEDVSSVDGSFSDKSVSRAMSREIARDTAREASRENRADRASLKVRDEYALKNADRGSANMENTRSKLDELSARLASLRNAEQTKTVETVREVKQVTSSTKTTSQSSSQSVQTSSQSQISMQSVQSNLQSQSNSQLVQDDARIVQGSAKMVSERESAQPRQVASRAERIVVSASSAREKGKYDEGEVKEALAGLLGAMSIQKQGDGE